MKSLEQIVQDILDQLPIDCLRYDIEPVILTALQQREQEHEAQAEIARLREGLDHATTTITGLSMTSDTGERREKWVGRRVAELNNILEYGDARSPKSDTSEPSVERQELLPCPFCGEPASKWEADPGAPFNGAYLEVGCSNETETCHIQPHASIKSKTQDDAENWPKVIAMWNQRAATAAVTTERDQLKAENEKLRTMVAAKDGALGSAQTSYELAELTDNPTYRQICAALSPEITNGFVRREVLQQLFDAAQFVLTGVIFTIQHDALSSALSRAETELKGKQP